MRTFHGGNMMLKMYTMLWVQNTKHFIERVINFLTAMGSEPTDFYYSITVFVYETISTIHLDLKCLLTTKKITRNQKKVPVKVQLMRVTKANTKKLSD
jgi:hypothetical protein